DGLALKRPRRQNSLPYGGWANSNNNPSGAIPGSYYGTGNNPNLGGYSNSDRFQSDINYSPYGSQPNLNSLPYYNGNQNQNAQGGQVYFGSNNMYNGLNRPNRYAPGSQGWYATGGNYNNKNISLTCNYLLMMLAFIFVL
ncbi:unnamed protein product, partial [Didymodactylos carnosus]